MFPGLGKLSIHLRSLTAKTCLHVSSDLWARKDHCNYKVNHTGMMVGMLMTGHEIRTLVKWDLKPLSRIQYMCVVVWFFSFQHRKIVFACTQEFTKLVSKVASCFFTHMIPRIGFTTPLAAINNRRKDSMKLYSLQLPSNRLNWPHLKPSPCFWI